MSANTYGRQVIEALTNKSGGGVVAGDVVVIDTTNNDAFTTSTAGSFTGMVGIAQETIANNAVGRVLTSGYAALVNVNASVTRGHYGKTYTVAKQATDAGASRVTAVFCQFLTGGTTPDAHVFGMPDGSSASGNVATDPIWAAAGDLAVGTGASTAAKLTKGATGTVPTAGASTLAYAFPPGYEFDYVTNTTDTVVTATTEGTANTVITANAVTYDGSTNIVVEFYSPNVRPQATAGSVFTFVLYDGAGSIGKLGRIIVPSATDILEVPLVLRVRLTPSAAAHTYSVRAYTDSGTAHAFPSGDGIGGSGHFMPQYIRQTKV